MLPVFEKLNQRRPETYKTDKCIVCKKKKENVEHLVSCEVSLNLLWSIEEQLVESILAYLDLKESLEESKEEVLRMLEKGTQADEMRKRERWIRGLITEEDSVELRTIFSSNNQTKKFIGVL